MWRPGLLLLLAAVAFGLVATTPLLGAKQCTWGPSFWCSNITNAKGCKAVTHCIHAVWEKQVVPEDDDEVCKICTDMVQQARDQLESNQTQEDLKAVFEGSCKLIPLKIISNECIKLVDDFIPELVETLASQMNPQMVCTVAGLCNNDRIDKMLANRAQIPISKEAQECNNCNVVVEKMRNRFEDTPYEKFLENSLRHCGRLGSFSDACATIVFSNFETIYTHLQNNFNPENVCHLSGTCSYKFHHKHKNENDPSAIEITPMGNVGRLDVDKDDVSCEMCKQLVIHLRDVLIANTTEEEFKMVLEGLCKQTGSFAKECLSLVDEYYPMIYEFLTKQLDPNGACFLVGICTKGFEEDGPIVPLVPANTAELAIKVIKNTNKKVIVSDQKPSSQSSVQVLQPELSQLPLDRMFIHMPASKEVCTFCQYFLHYVQEQITNDKTEEKIKEIVEKACKRLPNSIESECETFVEAYGDAMIALLAQDLDPSVVCPALTLCPKEGDILPQIEVLMTTGGNSKPNCPLCLFAVEQLETMLKDNKTEENIKHALENLCTHLPAKLRPECTDFVDYYSNQLVEMLSAEFTPQEVCVFLKLCDDNNPAPSNTESSSSFDKFHDHPMLMADKNRFKKPMLPSHMLSNAEKSKEEQIVTNEIPDNTFNGKTLIYTDVSSIDNVKTSPQCVLCEFVMSQVEKELKDQSNDEEIMRVVHNICNHMPKSVTKECNKFVDKYGDLVIQMLTIMTPSEICTYMKLCNDHAMIVKESIKECAICKELVSTVYDIVNNPNFDNNVDHILEKACNSFSDEYSDRCARLVKTSGLGIIHLVTHLEDVNSICSDIGRCGKSDYEHYLKIDRKKRETPLVGANKCTWGPSHWCANQDNANNCKALEYCRKQVWLAEKPPQQ